MTDTELSNPCLSHDSRWLPWTLFWKEFRQLGCYGRGTLLAGMGFLGLCLLLDVLNFVEFEQHRLGLGDRIESVEGFIQRVVMLKSSCYLPFRKPGSNGSPA